MSVANKKTKLSTLLLAALMTANFVCADTYKNNVLDVKVNKETGNAVKVTIYTDKPYTDPVVVNKKANNKYVILMPETKSSLKGAPTVNSSDGTVSNVSVNTQDVAGGKGYTKITITTDRAITIVPRTQQLGTSSSSTVSKPAQTASSKPTTTASQKTSQQKAAEEKAKQEQAKKAQLAAQQKAKQEAAKKAAAEKLKQEQAKKLAAQQKAKQEAAKKAAEQAKLAQAQKQPLEVLKEEVDTGKNANVTPPENDPVLDSQINENLKNNKKYAKKQKNKVVDTKDGSQSFIYGLKNVKTLIDNHNLNIWKLLLLVGAITFPIIVIMLILGLDKKINKKIETSFKKEEDYTSDVGISQLAQTGEKAASYETFDDAMSDTEQLTQNRQNLNVPPVIPADKQPQEFNNDYEDTDFEHNFEQSEVAESYDESVPTEIETHDEVIPPVIQDADSAESEQHDAVQEEFTPPAESYNPDGYLSEYSGVSDKDFFDELVLQSMAEENKDGLPEELPADEIFKFMSDDEQPSGDNPTEDIVIVEDSEEEPQNMSEQPIIDEFAEKTTVPETSTQASDDNLTMLTEVKLSDSTGLYLVNYENFSSLVGHINDEYFVIKKFNDIVNGNIILKPTEQLDNATRYLVRVGKSKMVVEVSDKSMSKLIDL